MFETPAWQAIQLAWEEADDTDDVAAKVERALALVRGRPGSRRAVRHGTGREAVGGPRPRRGRHRGDPRVPARRTRGGCARDPRRHAHERRAPRLVRRGDLPVGLLRVLRRRREHRASARGGRGACAGRALPDRHDHRRLGAAGVRAHRVLGGRRRRRRGGPRLSTPILVGSRRRGRSRTETRAWSAPRSCGSTRWRSSRICWPTSGSPRSRRSTMTWSRSRPVRAGFGSSPRCPARPRGRVAGTSPPRRPCTRA